MLDENGAVAKAWDLEPKTSLIAVQDKNGNILWAKEGELTAEEIQQVITLVKENL